MTNHNVENHNILGFQNALVLLIKKNDESNLRKILKPSTRYIFEIGEGLKCACWIEEDQIYYYSTKETNYVGDVSDLVDLVAVKRKTTEEIINVIGDAYKLQITKYNQEKSLYNKEKVFLFEKLLTDIGLTYVEINELRNCL
jgi:hypothetical protein